MNETTNLARRMISLARKRGAELNGTLSSASAAGVETTKKFDQQRNRDPSICLRNGFGGVVTDASIAANKQHADWTKASYNHRIMTCAAWHTFEDTPNRVAASASVT